MFVRSQKILNGIFIFCAVQFVLFFIYLSIIHGPLTKDNMLTLAFSLAFGLVFSGTARRDYQTYLQTKQKLDQLTDLDKALKRIQEENK